MCTQAGTHLVSASSTTRRPEAGSQESASAATAAATTEGIADIGVGRPSSTRSRFTNAECSRSRSPSATRHAADAESPSMGSPKNSSCCARTYASAAGCRVGSTRAARSSAGCRCRLIHRVAEERVDALPDLPTIAPSLIGDDGRDHDDCRSVSLVFASRSTSAGGRMRIPCHGSSLNRSPSPVAIASARAVAAAAIT